MSRVLIVEDDPALRTSLAITVRTAGHQVTTAGTAAEALTAAGAVPPDLVVLDLGLPDRDGTTVIRALRAWTDVPIIVLSGRAGGPDKVAALDAGADDYVTKPFLADELLARLRAAARRRGTVEDSPRVSAGDLVLDVAARTLVRDGEQVHLTPTEWAVLEVLVRHPGRLVTREELMRQVWGAGRAEGTDSLRTYLARLRRRLEVDPTRPRHLLTEPGLGYRFRP